MSEPLGFREEAAALWRCLPLYRESLPTDEIDRLDRALREAAAKALEWERDVIVKFGSEWNGRARHAIGEIARDLNRKIAALRTPSAPNAPKEADGGR